MEMSETFVEVFLNHPWLCSEGPDSGFEGSSGAGADQGLDLLIQNIIFYFFEIWEGYMFAHRPQCLVFCLSNRNFWLLGRVSFEKQKDPYIPHGVRLIKTPTLFAEPAFADRCFISFWAGIANFVNPGFPNCASSYFGTATLQIEGLPRAFGDRVTSGSPSIPTHQWAALRNMCSAKTIQFDLKWVHTV